MPAIVISFPGVLYPTRCYATKSLGPFPSSAILQFLPQVTAPSANGTLYLAHGGDSVSWYNAHIDRANLKYTTNGHIIEARVVDRRIWWQFTTVTGSYNQRRRDGSIISSTEKTVHELADILLTAMGETGYNYSVLPNNTDDRPLVNWKCSNPAMELHRLCEERGCAISLRDSTNQTVIVEVGSGSSIPLSLVKSVNFGVDITEYPETVRVCCDDTLYQAKIKLEPIGLDEGREIKKPDDLSYKPADPENWTKLDPFNPVPEESEEIQQLARRSLCRMFRPVTFADGTLDVPGGPILDSINEIILQTSRVEYYDDTAISGEFIPKPPEVTGVFYRIPRFGETEPIDNVPENTVYDGRFTIYPETGIVVFHEPVFKYDFDNEETQFPDLYLEVAFKVRSASSGQVLHYTYDHTLAGGVGVYPIRRHELQRIIRANYNPDDPLELLTDEPFIDNQDDLDTSIQNVITGILPKFNNGAATNTLVVDYLGIVNVDVDGVNRQVSHIVDMNTGANSRVSQNTEPEVGIMRLQEHSRLALIRQDQQRASESERQLIEHNRTSQAAGQDS